MMNISILGSGWLGFPLAQHFVLKEFKVNASTRTESHIKEIASIGAFPFIVDIDNLDFNLEKFFNVDVLIINIPSKNIKGFSDLIEKIKSSSVKKVLFVSSTSVYKNTNKTIFESDVDSYSESPLLEIERKFQKCVEFDTTIVRFGGLIGYTRQPGKFFSSGRIVKDPESPVNLIHRDDCIGIIGKIVEKGVFGKVFNCCADSHPIKKEFYSYAAVSIGCKPPKFENSEESSYKIISNQKVKELLNYKFKHPDLMNINFEES